uniref:Dibenzothiophene monooxygenase n=1 Tax=Marinobacter nauticus TaxID=2743 RepID=A0A455W4J4_MARNT|nr:hypothetical protein YBY_20550 [Marinobacter nauticus]
MPELETRPSPEETAVANGRVFNGSDLSKGASDAELNQRFRPLFHEIAETARHREKERELPYSEIRKLKNAGFGALRVPVAYGGFGASLPQLFRLLTELAEADSNITQALRGHFALVEDRLNSPASAHRDQWLTRFAKGDIAGNAWTEVGEVKIGHLNTRVSEVDGNWRINGEKYYTTGSIFADWLDVTAQLSEDPETISTVSVSTHQDGIKIEDNWDGFGQKTTGSGVTRLTNATVDPENIYPFAARFRYQTAFYQLVLLATLSGIGRAALSDLKDLVRSRSRVYSHGNADAVRDDPQIQQVVGSVAARVYAAESITLNAAKASQLAYEHHATKDPEKLRGLNIDAEIESAKAQVVVADLILSATSDLFNALGASATSTKHSLDRHWRNARTAASHNPLIYKEKVIGDWEINGTEPVYQWLIGKGK